MTRNARNLAAANHLRKNLTPKIAGEIMWTYSSPELYELLVLTRGWSPQRYGAFIADAMIAQLLPPETASPIATSVDGRNGTNSHPRARKRHR
jgi:hypothetical protein